MAQELPGLALAALYDAFVAERGRRPPAPTHEIIIWTLRRMTAPNQLSDDARAQMRRALDVASSHLSAANHASRPAQIPPIHWDAAAPYDFHITAVTSLVGVAWPLSLDALRRCGASKDRVVGLRSELPITLSDYRLEYDDGR